MAEKLYNLGSWISGNKWKVILSWILILCITISLGLSFKGEKSNELSIPGIESQEAIDLLMKEFPAGNNGSIQAIFKAPQGKTLEDETLKQAILSFVEQSKKNKSVVAAMDPYTVNTLSQDKRIGYANVYFNVPATQVTEESKEYVLDSAHLTKDAGIQTEFGGSVQLSSQVEGGSSEAIGIAIAYGVLLMTFMSMIVAGIPILTSIIGIVTGIMIVQFGSGFIEMHSTATSLALMLGLAVGIDYALLVISRVRQQLGEGMDLKESISIATATAGSAVIFAGLTVIIALAGLAVVNIPFLTIMGLAGAVTVLVSVGVAITLVPALISLAGKRNSPKKRKSAAKQGGSNLFGSWGRFVSRNPIVVIIGCILLLVAISFPTLHMETGLPDNGTKSEDTTERRGYDLLTEGFGPGFNGPLLVLVHSSSAASTKEASAKAAKDLQDFEHVVSVSPVSFNDSGTVGLLNLIPADGPTSDQTVQLVKSVRAYAEQLEKVEPAQLMLTGQTVVNIDVTDKLKTALPIFVGIIVGLGLILLAIVFRSIWVPIKAVVGFLFSICSSLGVVVLVFQDGYLNDFLGVSNVGPILNFLPILLVGIIFGLAMDYQVFLVTRMREDYTHSGDANAAVITGLEHNGRVVSVAAIIMIVVFGSFIINDDPIIKAMGVALAAGVLFDAFIVRMTLVPAIMAMMGRSVWYLPKWLDRILPNVDIEGESILAKKEKNAASTIKAIPTMNTEN